MSKRVPSQKHKPSKHPHHCGVPPEPLGPAATAPLKAPVPWWNPSRFLLGERLAANLALVVLMVGVTAQIFHFELGRQPALGSSPTFVPYTVAYDGGNTPPGNGCGDCAKGSGRGDTGKDSGGGDTGCGHCGSSVAFAGSTNTSPRGTCDSDIACGGGGGGCDNDCGSVGAMRATRPNAGFVAYEIAALMPRGVVMANNVARVTPGAGQLHSASVAREDTVGHPCESGNCRSPPIV
jgi:hypothetical protein